MIDDYYHYKYLFSEYILFLFLFFSLSNFEYWFCKNTTIL